MTQSGKTLFYFGIYVVSTGLFFLTIPATFLSLVQLPSLPTGWASAVGLLAIVIGTYDILAGKHSIAPLIKASVWVRLGFALGTVLIVLRGQMPPTLIMLGAIDALGAL